MAGLCEINSMFSYAVFGFQQEKKKKPECCGCVVYFEPQPDRNDVG